MTETRDAAITTSGRAAPATPVAPSEANTQLEEEVDDSSPSEPGPNTLTAPVDGQPQSRSGERRREFRRLGIYTPRMLQDALRNNHHRRDLIEGLIGERSVNVLIGDSGLGKTPLCVQIGLCVAAGVPLFGRPVQQGKVLYCDAESDRAGFDRLLSSISLHLNLGAPPDDFHVWSPNWDDRRPRPTNSSNESAPSNPALSL
jgi:hypothetical protein